MFNIKLKMKQKKHSPDFRIGVILVIGTKLIFDEDTCHRVFLFFRRMNRVCNLPRISVTKNQRRAKDGRVGRSTCGPSNWSKNHRPTRCNKYIGDTTVKTYPRYFTKYRL